MRIAQLVVSLIVLGQWQGEVVCESLQIFLVGHVLVEILLLWVFFVAVAVVVVGVECRRAAVLDLILNHLKVARFLLERAGGRLGLWCLVFAAVVWREVRGWRVLKKKKVIFELRWSRLLLVVVVVVVGQLHHFHIDGGGGGCGRWFVHVVCCCCGRKDSRPSPLLDP